MNTTVRRVLTAAAVLAATAGLGTTTASARPGGQDATAQPAAITWYHGGAPTSGCRSHYGYLCAYKDITWGGSVGYFEYSNPQWSQTQYSSLNDSSSSWYNNGTPGSYSSVVIYQDAWYQNTSVCIDQGWGISHYPELSDKVSSNKWVNGPCP